MLTGIVSSRRSVDLAAAFLWGMRIGMYEAHVAKTDDKRQAIYDQAVALMDELRDYRHTDVAGLCKRIQGIVMTRVEATP